MGPNHDLPESHRPPGPRRRRLRRVVLVGSVLVVSILVRAFVLQQFTIPSPSMADTLRPGDRVMVNKLAYEVRDVHRGDVVVFPTPTNINSDVPEAAGVHDLIKRVVGLPGERVSISDGLVHIDGRVLAEPYTDGRRTVAHVGGRLADLADRMGCGRFTEGIDSAEGFLVPTGTVLVMGDNRNWSLDGRCFGPIDEDTIIGRASFVLWPPGRFGSI